MDVTVDFKRAQRLLRSPRRSSLLGNSILDRARSTTLALLGATAAVGLAMVALALNQSWPLVAGSPIPLIPPAHEGIGKATVAAGVVREHTPRVGAAGDSGRSDVPPRAGGTRAAHASPPASAEFVVSPSSPVPSGEGGGSDRSPQGTPAPAPSQPQNEPAESPSAPVSSPTPPPQSTGTPVVAPPAPPAPTTAETPGDEQEESEPESGSEDESGVPSWSNGNGHAYGRGGR